MLVYAAQPWELAVGIHTSPPSGFPVAQMVKICLQCGRSGFHPWLGKIPWGRAWQPTPVFLPGESHERRSLAGYSPWGRQQSDTTEWLIAAEHIPSLRTLPPHPPARSSRSSQSNKLSSLRDAAATHQLSTWHTAVYICQCCSLSSSHPFLLCPRWPFTRRWLS